MATCSIAPPGTCVSAILRVYLAAEDCNFSPMISLRQADRLQLAVQDAVSWYVVTFWYSSSFPHDVAEASVCVTLLTQPLEETKQRLAATA